MLFTCALLALVVFKNFLVELDSDRFAATLLLIVIVLALADYFSLRRVDIRHLVVGSVHAALGLPAKNDHHECHIDFVVFHLLPLRLQHLKFLRQLS